LGAIVVKKKIAVVLLSLALMVIIYFLALHPAKPVSLTIPAISLEERICDRVTAQFGDCKRILLFDADAHLVFAESSSGIIPVLTNKEFTDFKKLILPIMDFQEFNEEKVERGPIDWRAENKVQNDFSIIYGFAEDDAKTIVINSEGNLQPTRFFVRENLWVWYVTVQKDEVKLPVEVSVYDAKGEIISE
jgi:hypothetical protein